MPEGISKPETTLTDEEYKIINQYLDAVRDTRFLEHWNKAPENNASTLTNSLQSHAINNTVKP